MKKINNGIVEDPAKAHPWKRYILRRFTTHLFIYLSLLIPVFIFYTISILAGLSTEIGIFLAFISFLVYIYILWKKELWNKIIR